MPRVTLRDVGSIGLITDTLAHELPPEAWSRVENISFRNRRCVRMLGETVVFGMPAVEPYYLFPSPSQFFPYWVYTDLIDVYAVVGNTHSKITRVSGPYTGGEDDRWNGEWINGVLILNNGVDKPQQWQPIDTGTKLQDLLNWPADMRAKVIRGFQNFVIALDITDTGTRYSTTFKWSHPADPGQVPPTWDVADATKLAGDRPLSGTPGRIIDGKQLGQAFMIYKEDAVYRATRIQTNEIFDTQPISLVAGIAAQQCVQEFQPNKHIFLTLESDVCVTDGYEIVSVLDKKNYSTLENRIDSANLKRAFVVANQHLKEVYVCYPRSGSEYCNEMAVWNWVDATWSFQALTATLDIKAGIYDEQAVSDVWNADNEVWNTDTTTWNERKFGAAISHLLGAFPTEGQIRQVKRGQKLGPYVTYAAKLERMGLALVGQARDGTPRVDPNKVKLITEVYPLMTTPLDITMKIYVGAQDFALGPITWNGPYFFNPLRDEKIDCYCEGRYIGVRFECDDEVPWELTAYGLQVELVGEYL